MGQRPQSSLHRPAESGVVRKNFRISFKQGTQSATAVARVFTADDEEQELLNRRAAEKLARTVAEQKYEADFHEPVEWASAQVVVTHTAQHVSVSIYVTF